MADRLVAYIAENDFTYVGVVSDPSFSRSSGEPGNFEIRDYTFHETRSIKYRPSDNNYPRWLRELHRVNTDKNGTTDKLQMLLKGTLHDLGDPRLSND